MKVVAHLVFLVFNDELKQHLLQCVRIFTPNITCKSIVLRNVKLAVTIIVWYVDLGHIDVHPDKKWFDFISYLDLNPIF